MQQSSRYDLFHLYDPSWENIGRRVPPSKDVEKVLATTGDPTRLALALIARCGLRTVEVLGLTSADILEDCTLRVRDRVLGIPGDLHVALERVATENEALFPFSRQNLDKAVRSRIGFSAGDLRVGYAAHMLVSGGSPLAIAAIMGITPSQVCTLVDLRVDTGGDYIEVMTPY